MTIIFWDKCLGVFSLSDCVPSALEAGSLYPHRERPHLRSHLCHHLCQVELSGALHASCRQEIKPREPFWNAFLSVRREDCVRWPSIFQVERKRLRIDGVEGGLVEVDLYLPGLLCTSGILSWELNMCPFFVVVVGHLFKNNKQEEYKKRTPVTHFVQWFMISFSFLLLRYLLYFALPVFIHFPPLMSTIPTFILVIVMIIMSSGSSSNSGSSGGGGGTSSGDGGGVSSAGSGRGGSGATPGLCSHAHKQLNCPTSIQGLFRQLHSQEIEFGHWKWNGL